MSDSGSTTGDWSDGSDPDLQKQMESNQQLTAMQNYQRFQSMRLLNNEMVRASTTFGFSQRPEPTDPFAISKGQAMIDAVNSIPKDWVPLIIGEGP
jgi:hypothetical protein